MRGAPPRKKRLPGLLLGWGADIVGKFCACGGVSAGGPDKNGPVSGL